MVNPHHNILLQCRTHKKAPTSKSGLKTLIGEIGKNFQAHFHPQGYLDQLSQHYFFMSGQKKFEVTYYVTWSWGEGSASNFFDETRLSRTDIMEPP